MIVRLRHHSKGALFVHPIEPVPRTAILTAGFRETRLVRVFPQGWNEHVKRFDPACIAGPFDRLQALAREGWPLEQAVVAFTYAGGPVLSQDDRDLLWHGFGVPVFEQYLDHDYKLLATECEAHAGLHVLSGCEDLPVEHDVCPCGNPAPRLMRGPRIDELVGLLA